ncbi:MAG: deoxyguanosinetriphosphate triphosphohydrolase [Omnitrophica WOR_2 bacterium SM23_29]|nr:MAG: deoxyguanosinetriphosphate triphosphohydrolase [Omnitrophica WOR_2 bacterium SM23_29]
MLSQNRIKEFEDKFLAPYAMKSYQTRGRLYKEEEHPYRSAYQRDRDRIIHSAAFRKLEYKTQVFVIYEGDSYRTRITHTLEVAQIARTIASAFSLNVDLAEAIALAHDLGHTPFGHAGEEILNELMRGEGGFNHNFQGLRVVDILEEKYPNFPGLNLSWEVREGIIKHSSIFDHSIRLKEFIPQEQATMEAQIVDVADEIAYDNHDLDDGLTSGLLSEEDLFNLSLWRRISDDINKKYKKIDSDKRRYQIIKSLIDIQVTDVIKSTEARLKETDPRTWQDIKKLNKRMVEFSQDMLSDRKPLRKLLLERFYHHYRIVRMSAKAKKFIEELFNTYIKNPLQLPITTQKRIKEDGLRRAVCDYIAGMTDRSTLDEYEKLFDPHTKV